MTCDHCPLSGTAAQGTCPGHRYCELTDAAHPDHDPRYRRVLLVKSGLEDADLPVRPADPAWFADAGAVQHWMPPSREAARKAVQSILRGQALDAIVNACVYRGCKVGCGNSKCDARRGDSGGGELASIGHCRSCAATELVVAHYHEDLAWLPHSPVRPTVYTKGGEAIPDAVPLPNVGREAHTMLWHIVNRWESLADWTFFAQADPFDHAPDFLERLTLRYDRATPPTRQYLPDIPTPEIKAADRVESVAGHEVRWGLGNYFGQFGGAARGRTQEWCERVWSQVFACPIPEQVWFGYGAMWAVPRESITRRPLEFWQWLLEQAAGPAGQSFTDRDDAHPLTAWAFELIWGYLWDDPEVHPHRTPWDSQ